jgi:myo-inositol-1(or 4)-monophosphatase
MNAAHDLEARLQFALQTAARAAALAYDYYRQFDSLTIEKKGHQDLVSNGDREVEQLVRDAIISSYPEDGIVGEEFENKPSQSGMYWVIDPIDGTASFVRGRPGWCVVIGCVQDDEAVVGVIADPVTSETFHAVKNGGAFLNGKPVKTSQSDSLGDGAVGTGYSSRAPAAFATTVIHKLLAEENGMLYQNGSGALMLSYVACGRLVGYTESHMYPWDCMAAMLLIKEAGGTVQPHCDDTPLLSGGGRVVAACPGVFDRLAALSNSVFDSDVPGR